MRVTKAQAEANRARIVETSSTLFRERGYDGIGIADLMDAAGLTHGGFYKNFKSKAALVEEAAVCGILKTVENTRNVDLIEFVDYYTSRRHRDERGSGCTIAALGGDAARQPDALKSKFAAGVEMLVATLAKSAESNHTSQANRQFERSQILASFAAAVGAVVVSRACPGDSELADEVLQACRDQIHTSLNART
ncbi:hypothetical protein ALO71_200032 [Pseudomonas amygdali pv. dendropanacis]|uniref:HTH tetR-type domain-containing protein n=1 Tax=Pseudomonas amygdali pv. dendropanacis TaxID=235272 RepID=A0A0P9QFS9_PSEA0|nr:TetR/AcrR family transcriptional regulator [Pseudomonas amygdali]KPX13666.1 hypothetical protein ALO71_200032 [Pseudomonas amygdali pv. dendropanacis]KWS81244.1 TetR family transcriptional regulator [Pseudomonas amygdali pv. dendropanacis]